MWFHKHQTQIGEAHGVPALTGMTLMGKEFELEPAQVLIMGWNFQHIAAWEIWWKLLFDSLPQCNRYFMGFNTMTFERRHLAVLDQCVPTSRHPRTCIWRDERDLWSRWVEWTPEEQVLAVLLRNDGSALYMKGIPTEEAWETFEREFKRELSLWESRQAELKQEA